MNTNVFRSSSTSIFVKPSLDTSSALKPIQDRIITRESSQAAIKSNINPVSDVYYPNVLNSSLKFTDELEASRSELVKTRNKTTFKKRLFWWC